MGLAVAGPGRPSGAAVVAGVRVALDVVAAALEAAVHHHFHARAVVEGDRLAVDDAEDLLAVDGALDGLQRVDLGAVLGGARVGCDIGRGLEVAVDAQGLALVEGGEARGPDCQDAGRRDTGFGLDVHGFPFV